MSGKGCFLFSQQCLETLIAAVDKFMRCKNSILQSLFRFTNPAAKTQIICKKDDWQAGIFQHAEVDYITSVLGLVGVIGSSRVQIAGSIEADEFLECAIEL
jgi:hypothetical protein